MPTEFVMLAPLEGEDLERYYVDLSHVRKTEAIEGVSTILEFQEVGQNSTTFVQLFFF